MINIDATLLNDNKYNFLKSDNHLGNSIILLGLGGSYAYGTNIETSDIDIRGIALNSSYEILCGKDFEQVVNSDTDTTIYSFNKIINLLSKCNPNTIELLGLEESDYFILTDIGRQLLENKKMFLSKECVKSFGGYANQQLYRLQQKSLCALSRSEYNNHICNVINNLNDNFKNKYNINAKAYLSNDEIKININSDINADVLSSALSEIDTILSTYNRESNRNKRAIDHNKINKHAMHLIRLYQMCLDMLEKGEINTKRKDNDLQLLMDIRNGEYLGEDGKPNKEFYSIVSDLEKRFNYAKNNTDLPDKPDYDKIRDFKMSINKYVIMEDTYI